MNVLFDGYNPFCINRIYLRPTTVATPARKPQEITKQPIKPDKITPQRNTLATSNASCNKLCFDIFFQILLVPLFLLLN